MAYTAESLKATVNQGKIIKAIEEDYQKEDNKEALKQVNYISRGMCYMLSIEWLRLIHETLLDDHSGQTLPDWKLEFGTIAHFSTPQGLAYYKQIANNFIAYKKRNTDEYACITHKIEEGKDIKIDDDKAFVEVCTKGRLEVKNFNYPLDKNGLVDKIMEGAPFMLLGIYFSKGAHEAALYYKGNEKKIYFFDCNAGIYEITAQDEAELRSKVVTLVDEMWTTYGVEKADCSLVEGV